MKSNTYRSINVSVEVFERMRRYVLRQKVDQRDFTIKKFVESAIEKQLDREDAAELTAA